MLSRRLSWHGVFMDVFKVSSEACVCVPVLAGELAASSPFSPSSFKSSFPSRLSKVIAGDPQPAPTSWTGQVPGMGLCLPSSWQEQAQEIQAVLVAFLSWAPPTCCGIWGDQGWISARGVLFAPCKFPWLRLVFSFFRVKHFSWEFHSSSAACSHCWAPLTVLVQLSEEAIWWTRSVNSKKGYF